MQLRSIFPVVVVASNLLRQSGRLSSKFNTLLDAAQIPISLGQPHSQAFIACSLGFSPMDRCRDTKTNALLGHQADAQDLYPAMGCRALNNMCQSEPESKCGFSHVPHAVWCLHDWHAQSRLAAFHGQTYLACSLGFLPMGHCRDTKSNGWHAQLGGFCLCGIVHSSCPGFVPPWTGGICDLGTTTVRQFCVPCKALFHLQARLLF